MAIHAVALRAFNIGANPATAIALDQFLPDVAEGQFLDFERAKLVREATAEEIAAHGFGPAEPAEPVAPPAPPIEAERLHPDPVELAAD